jgi:prepilin-type N-terminal cleavage/methylation domain-containing protein
LNNQKGFSLVEILVSIALLSVIGVALLSSLGTSSKALMTMDQRQTAKNIAEAVMEHIKSVDYLTYYPLDDGNPATNDIQDILDNYPGYSVANTDGKIYITPIDGRSISEIHQIDVTVLHNGLEIFTLTGFKTN